VNYDWSEDLDYQMKRGYEIATVSCSCEYPYHQIWGTLRNAAISSPFKFEAAHIASLLNSQAQKRLRVLVAGTADCGTPFAIGKMLEGRDFSITVVDRCEAPLKLISELSSQRNLPCNVIHEDILNLDLQAQFDTVVVNYTVTYVDKTKRLAFFERLNEALDQSGELICAVLTKDDAQNTRAWEMEKWIEAARERIGTISEPLPMTEHELVELLEVEARYRKKRNEESGNTTSSIAQSIRQAGFVITLQVEASQLENSSRSILKHGHAGARTIFSASK
jgi:hypothetical protein